MKSNEVFKNKKIYVFLPHQDDEIAIWPIWKDILKASEIYVFCLTNGELQNSLAGKLRYVRNKELIENLSKNGVKKENIFFLSNDLPPNDQLLHEFFMTVIENLQKLLERLDAPDFILTTAAEGGHPDHDVANFLVRFFARKFFKKTTALEFYLYSRSTRWFPFNLGRPEIISNDTIAFKLKRRFLFHTVKAMLIYRSQRKTFCLLGPFFITRCFFQPKIFFKKLDLQNGNFERPVNSIILYEQRGWIKFNAIKKIINQFIEE